ncbi:MAG: hypothetical protein L6V86_03680 [Treponema sp.]|nr:MAG: hypothetical protein L6V86_03680 [Treponema sp.]
MTSTIVEQKIKQLPEYYITLVNDYVDELLKKSKKIDSLKGSLSKYANPRLREQEKSAWAKGAVEKHLDE